jgi:hypothetical protein
MNAKLCKILRRQAHRMTARLAQREGVEPIARQLMYRDVKPNPRSPAKTAIVVLNNRKTTRGIYRGLKRSLRNAPAETRATVRQLG